MPNLGHPDIGYLSKALESTLGYGPLLDFLLDFDQLMDLSLLARPSTLGGCNRGEPTDRSWVLPRTLAKRESKSSLIK